MPVNHTKLACAIFLMTITLLFAQTKTSSVASATQATSDEAVLRELKEVLWPRAYFEQDTKLLDRILADEFQRIDGAGNWFSKAGELERVAKNRPTYDTLVFKIRRLEILENGTAVVAGTGTIRGKDDNGAYVAEYQSTNILIKRNGVWRAIASHVSGYKRLP